MKSVAELYSDHPFDHEERYWPYNVSLNDSIVRAEELHIQEDPVAYLDELLDSDRSRAMDINNALLALPPKAILDNFGTEAAIWASSNATMEGESNALNSVLESQAGINKTDLETSRLWQWNKHYNSKGKPIVATYQSIQDVKDGALDKIDLEKLLVHSTRPGVTLSAKRLADYALTPITLERYNTWSPGGWVKEWTKDVSETLRYDMWLDAPVGYALTYKGLPNAMAGIAMRGQDELMMYQIQGVRGNRLDPTASRYSKERVIGKVNSRGLAPLDWQGLLVSTAESLAQNRGAKYLGIQAGKNNYWVKPHRHDEEAHISLETAERTYDSTAQRLGFEINPEDPKGNWCKEI